MARLIVLDASTAETRRSLGPTAWLVLEELLLISEPAPDGRMASVSLGSLAASLGLAKDSACRAVRRLRSAGFVAAMQRRADRGTFDIGTYRITVPSAIIVVESETPRHRVARLQASQLSLPIEP